VKEDLKGSTSRVGIFECTGARARDSGTGDESPIPGAPLWPGEITNQTNLVRVGLISHSRMISFMITPRYRTASPLSPTLPRYSYTTPSALRVQGMGKVVMERLLRIDADVAGPSLGDLLTGLLLKLSCLRMFQLLLNLLSMSLV